MKHVFQRYFYLCVCTGSQRQMYFLLWVKVKNVKTTDPVGVLGGRAAGAEFTPSGLRGGRLMSVPALSLTRCVTVWGGPSVSQELPQLTHL